MFKRFQFPAFAPRLRVFGSEFPKIRAHQSGESGVTLHRKFADFLDQIVVDRKRDIHRPIIRETLNKGKQECLKFVLDIVSYQGIALAIPPALRNQKPL